jgi:hypothetical protein
VDNSEWDEFLKGLKIRWKSLWQDKIDDKVRAEGVASDDYDMLFIDQGTVIVATRNYKPPSFGDIVEQHAISRQLGRVIVTSPKVGGWGKFARDVLRRQTKFTKHGRPIPSAPKKKQQQLKKGGRGWLHAR